MLFCIPILRFIGLPAASSTSSGEAATAGRACSSANPVCVMGWRCRTGNVIRHIHKIYHGVGIIAIHACKGIKVHRVKGFHAFENMLSHAKQYRKHKIIPPKFSMNCPVSTLPAQLDKVFPESKQFDRLFKSRCSKPDNALSISCRRT